MDGQPVFQALYDGDGRRIETMAGDTSIYHYQASSWDPCYVKDLTTGLTSDIVFAAGLRIGKVQAGVSSFYHLDRLGSVRLVTQAASPPVFSAKYLPYGNTYTTSGAEAFQYTGKQLDVATGLSYYGYRYYDSESGRFISVDLAQANYLNPQSLNRYTYALNNPNRYTDPDGAKLPEAAYDIGRVAGASAEKSWEELDKEQREIIDAYEECASHHSHPMRFDRWLKMMFGASGNTEPSDTSLSTSTKVPRGALLGMEYGTSTTDVITGMIDTNTSITGMIGATVATSTWTNRQQWGAIHLIMGAAIVFFGIALSIGFPPAAVYGIAIATLIGVPLMRTGIGELTTPNWLATSAWSFRFE